MWNPSRIVTLVIYRKTYLTTENETIMIRLSDENDTIVISDWKSADWYGLLINEYNEINHLIDESESGWFWTVQHIKMDKVSC